jgi:hypothetical protein
MLDVATTLFPSMMLVSLIIMQTIDIWAKQTPPFISSNNKVEKKTRGKKTTKNL